MYLLFSESSEQLVTVDLVISAQKTDQKQDFFMEFISSNKISAELLSYLEGNNENLKKT